jgi:hypothetical protein
MSFFAVYLIQQGMLAGLTLPLYAVFASHEAWHPTADSIATIGCLIGEILGREGAVLQLPSMIGSSRCAVCPQPPPTLAPMPFLLACR